MATGPGRGWVTTIVPTGGQDHKAASPITESAPDGAPLDVARPRGDLGTSRCAELGQDVLDVAARRLRRDAQRTGDLGVGQTFGHRAAPPRTRALSAAATVRQRRPGHAPAGRSASALSASGRLSSRDASVLTSTASETASAKRFDRTRHDARSRRAQAASHVRPTSSHPRIAVSSAIRATPVDPETSDDAALDRARGRQRSGPSRRSSCSVHAASQASAADGRPAACSARTPGRRTGSAG